MDELVKRQMESRDSELNIYKETQLKQNPLGKIENPLGKIENPLGKIENPLGKIENPLGTIENPLDIIDLGVETSDFASQKKTVHWSSNPPRSILKNPEPRRDELKEFMNDIRNSVRMLQNELDVIKQTQEPIAPPEVLQNPNVSNILSRLRKPGGSSYTPRDMIDPNSRILPRHQIYMEEENVL
jgi:archaellum component FlaC